MFKLKPSKPGTKEIPGVTFKDLALGHVKYSKKSPLVLTRELRGRHGEIFKIALGDKGLIFLASQRMVAPLLSMPDCEKVAHGSLVELRTGNGEDGLFTMYNDDPEWGIAHRLLVPAFGVLSIRNMYDQMSDILVAMLTRWSAYENTVMNLPDQLTRLTLDTIALCSFDYRFNSFYKDEMHPFVNDMLEFLGSTATRVLNPVFSPLRVDLSIKWKAARKRMGDFGDQIIAERKKGLSHADDLCARTGKKLSDKNVRAQLLTFLVAGHETTSGMLSFCFYFMMKDPEVMYKAQAEVDNIGQITRDSLTKMPYIEACLKEALRLEPTAPMFGVKSHKECTLADEFVLPAGQEVMIDLHGLHRDPQVFPEPEAFKPERWLSGETLPPHAYKPFGNGPRACIGRAFAMQEAILAVAGIIQNFDMELADSQYNLKTKFTLTIKPDHLMVRIKKRRDALILPLAANLKPSSSQQVPLPVVPHNDHAQVVKDEAAHAMTILYGSEAGCCQTLGKEVQVDATARGYVATLNTLDSCSELPKTHPVVILSSSYEGRAPANAVNFVKRLESSKQGDLKDVSYAVFGAGHHEWVETYQAVPKQIDDLLQKQGAKPILDRGLGDVAGDFIDDFEKWKTSLFSALLETHVKPLTNGAAKAAIENFRVLPSKATHENSSIATIIEARSLADATDRGKEKCHIGISLPDVVYQPGDYLDVFPCNSASAAVAVLEKFNLDVDTKITVLNGSQEKTVRGLDHLRHDVDLSKPVPRYSLGIFAKNCTSPEDQAKLKEIHTNQAAYKAEILDPYVTVMALAQKYPSCKLSFETFLECLEPLRSRRYSISSSPAFSETLTLTYDVSGLTSTFMKKLTIGQHVTCAVRPAKFHLPEDPLAPAICFATGTGIAPFRAFFQHRYHQYTKGIKTGPLLLFYGCRNSDDELYVDEFKKWSGETKGLLTRVTSYSRAEHSEYVPDKVVLEKQTIYNSVQAGAELFVCGSIAFATSLRAAWTAIAAEPQYAGLLDVTNSGRYKVDIFG